MELIFAAEIAWLPSHEYSHVMSTSVNNNTDNTVTLSCLHMCGME